VEGDDVSVPYDRDVEAMGLAPAAEAFVAAIAEDRRAFWDRILITAETPSQPPRLPEEVLYAVFLRRERYISFPVPEAVLRDSAPLSSWMERAARTQWEEGAP
jgi:hypothetical protein